RLNDWGNLLYECSQQKELDANRRVQLREAASAVWQKMIAVEPNHPQTICRVAQLESRSGNYSRAVELLSDYAREHQTSEEILQHLGEVYWAMNRREEAVSTWKKIAALPEFSNASAEGGSDQRSESRRLTNAIRAARILQRYQLPFEAISLVESCLKVQTNLPADEVPPNDEIVNGWMVLSDFLVDAGQWEDALSALRTASKASKSTETRRLVFQKQVNVLRAMGGLEDSIRMLSRTLTDQPPQTTSRDGFFEGWWQLALLYEANQQLPEAADAIIQAVRISENAARDSDSRPSISLLTTAMTICESALQFEDAISFAEQLVRSDSENAFDHLSHLIELHERAFRAGYSQHKQRIVKASDRLMEVFPDRPETWLRVSEVQLHNNWVADGIQTLMKAAVRFPEDQSIQMAYGYALSQHGQISEAITHWWGLFDKATSYPQRAAIVELLAPLYGRLERCEALISEIHDRTVSAAGSREAELLAVTAWRAAGNVSMARQTLQSLL
ncbi:MAG: hypothetical protein KDA91_25830, partial [Planctomycetaceae bacterium]|nr:hypothetical protein [Planctomycetaceae bacterium]